MEDVITGRNMPNPPSEAVASKLNNQFGLDFGQIESLWDMGYANGGYLKKTKSYGNRF